MLPGLGVIAGLVGASAEGTAVNPVNINNETASKVKTDGTAATASFTFRTDRTVKDQDNANLDASWLDSGYSAADYQIRVTKVSGTTPVGTLNSWLALSSNRTWSLTDDAGAAGSKSCVLTVEIRDAAAPNTIRDTATYTLEADSQASGGGGGSANWTDINTTTSLSSVNGSTNSQTMGASGTLTIAYSTSDAISMFVYKNGVNQGAATSLSVSAGDTISFSASGTGFANPETRTGTITVSGLENDVISVRLERSTL